MHMTGILTRVSRSCIPEHVKRITPDDAAYNRLKALKQKSSEAFSSGMKPVIPEPGSLGAFLAFVEQRGTSARQGNALLEAAVEVRSEVKSDPWT